MRTLPLLFLLACTTGASVEDEAPSDTGTEDTGTSDTGTEDTGTTDTGTTDTGDTQPGPTSTFEARYGTAPGADWRVGTWLVHFDANGFVYVREYSSTPATGFPQSFDVAAPRGADQMDNQDGSFGAYWFVFAYGDTDGDGGYDNGEPIHAVGPRMLGWIDQFQGQQDVYFSLEFNDEGGADYFAAEDGFDLANVLGPDSITLSGTTNWQGSPQGRPDRVATIAQDEFGGTLVPNRPLDEALNSPFSWTISGDPNASRQINDQGFVYALEIPYGYVDEDTSGDYSTGDTLSSALCRGGDPVYLFWSPAPDGIEGASINAVYGLGSGWLAYASTATEEELLTDTSGLTMSPTDCGF